MDWSVIDYFHVFYSMICAYAFSHFYQAFCRHSELLQLQKTFFWTFWYSKRFLEVVQKYFQAWQKSGSFYNFRKMFRTFRDSRSFLEVLQKYLQVCQTFWSFCNFWKILRPTVTPGVFLKSYKNISKLAWHFGPSTTTEKLFRNSTNLRKISARLAKILYLLQFQNHYLGL